MHEFKTLSGRLIEARRYLTRAARLRDHDPARERWELWLTTADGQEEKHVVASRLMPARSGHAVTLILLGDEPVGMFNLDAGYRVNFARADPALLLRPVDVAFVVFGALASILASAFTGPAIFVLAVPVLALYMPALAAVRLRNRSVLQRQVDRLLDQMQVDHVVRPFRRRS